MLRLRGGLAPASGTKGALKVDLSQARKRTARSKGKWTGASRPFASGDSDEDSEDEEPDDSGNEFDKMLAKDEDDDPLSGDVEEIAALSFDEWQARVQVACIQLSQEDGCFAAFSSRFLPRKEQHT